jgi:hypothetical protein
MKKGNKSTAAPEHQSSQTAGQTSAQLHAKRTQTIPIAQVVTEAVPASGRLQWYLWGNKNRAGDGAQGGESAQGGHGAE